MSKNKTKQKKSKTNTNYFDIRYGRTLWVTHRNDPFYTKPRYSEKLYPPSILSEPYLDKKNKDNLVPLAFDARMYGEVYLSEQARQHVLDEIMELACEKYKERPYLKTIKLSKEQILRIICRYAFVDYIYTGTFESNSTFAFNLKRNILCSFPVCLLTRASINRWRSPEEEKVGSAGRLFLRDTYSTAKYIKNPMHRGKIKSRLGCTKFGFKTMEAAGCNEYTLTPLGLEESQKALNGEWYSIDLTKDSVLADDNYACFSKETGELVVSGNLYDVLTKSKQVAIQTVIKNYYRKSVRAYVAEEYDKCHIVEVCMEKLNEINYDPDAVYESDLWREHCDLHIGMNFDELCKTFTENTPREKIKKCNDLMTLRMVYTAQVNGLLKICYTESKSGRLCTNVINVQNLTKKNRAMLLKNYYKIDVFCATQLLPYIFMKQETATDEKARKILSKLVQFKELSKDRKAYRSCVAHKILDLAKEYTDQDFSGSFSALVDFVKTLLTAVTYGKKVTHLQMKHDIDHYHKNGASNDLLDAFLKTDLPEEVYMNIFKLSELRAINHESKMIVGYFEKKYSYMDGTLLNPFDSGLNSVLKKKIKKVVDSAECLAATSGVTLSEQDILDIIHKNIDLRRRYIRNHAGKEMLIQPYTKRSKVFSFIYQGMERAFLNTMLNMRVPGLTKTISETTTGIGLLLHDGIYIHRDIFESFISQAKDFDGYMGMISNYINNYLNSQDFLNPCILARDPFFAKDRPFIPANMRIVDVEKEDSSGEFDFKATPHRAFTTPRIKFENTPKPAEQIIGSINKTIDAVYTKAYDVFSNLGVVLNHVPVPA